MGDRYFTYKTLSNEHILDKVRGVIHVGANYGQEREVYAHHHLSVLWFEPIPKVWKELNQNIKQLRDQWAYQFAVWDEDEQVHFFHVTDNEGQSSSVLEFGKHTDLWPEVHHTETIYVCTVTLNSFFKSCPLSVHNFDFLVIDAQGAELHVLKGSDKILPRVKFVQVEATDCELYKGCAKLSEIDAFMRGQGFKEIERTAFSPRPDIGQCYEVTYERI